MQLRRVRKAKCALPRSIRGASQNCPSPLHRICLAALSAVAAVALAQPPPSAEQIAGRLTANDLKADVSFLASDALEGRATPSAGLEIAAEYVAAEFRRAVLEPGGDDGYFQTASHTSNM